MIIIRAKYIIISPEIVIENSGLAIDKGVVKGIHYGPGRQTKGRVYDFGRSIISPGLINAHTHLEGPPMYGNSRNPVKPPQQFIKWAPQVIARRKLLKPRDYIRIIKDGYRICGQNGTTALVDHTHLQLALPAHKSAGLRRILVEETVALDKNQAGETLNRVKKALREAGRWANGLLKTGLAPHAPFSVSPELYKMLFKLARQKHCPMSTHLSELKEEVEFLKTGKGRMVEYLKGIGRATPNWKAPRTTPVGYMKKLGILKPPAFFVHCNYLTGNDIKLMAASGCSVVFCPNSHDYFGHRKHPLIKLLRAGVNVALGTDGLGSNQDLHILKEMKFIREHYPALTPSQIFRMGTANPARLLGLENKIGLLKPGYAADLAVFPASPSLKISQVLDYLIKKTPRSVCTMVNGSVIQKG